MELLLNTSDFTGLKCPLPVLKAKRVIKIMKKGDCHTFLSDDVGSPIDFSHLCKSENLELNIKKKDMIFIFEIKKK